MGHSLQNSGRKGGGANRRWAQERDPANAFSNIGRSSSHEAQLRSHTAVALVVSAQADWEAIYKSTPRDAQRYNLRNSRSSSPVSASAFARRIEIAVLPCPARMRRRTFRSRLWRYGCQTFPRNSQVCSLMSDDASPSSSRCGCRLVRPSPLLKEPPACYPRRPRSRGQFGSATGATGLEGKPFTALQHPLLYNGVFWLACRSRCAIACVRPEVNPQSLD